MVVVVELVGLHMRRPWGVHITFMMQWRLVILENTLAHGILFCDVLQPLDAEIFDADVVGHELGGYKHLVSPSGHRLGETPLSAWS